MKAGRLFFFEICCLLVLTACGQTHMTKYEAFPRMYAERPLAILVLPPINETTAADAKEYYSTTIAEPLSFSGYYVFPIEVISEIMKNEGLYDTEALLNLPPNKFKEYFGADAVMYIWIKKWSTSYYVIGGNVSVSIRSAIKSTTTGDDLWQYEGTIIEDTTVTSSGGGLAGLAVAIIATAAKTAATDYVPIAKRANYMILNTIPCGKYHPKHDKDREEKAVIEKVMRTRK
ncbi:hypothetical protein CO010_02430 [Candidatus Shapirobacteria bacterium CG_4_8_14_3_um_filter_39_11]|uniref:Lipoprotein n=1 Tax=Candidatus Shapirobacteria bacterium CG_4_8_14_3_um_filter_39_11 TaxID=1974875 RepID=A0A2M8GGT4_9BACT|nr:MAG: hypothetical protein CO010_02430 [Candidatus Shapirobacteria bacterium CG_4_8_14_3_um_filter_39_11]